MHFKIISISRLRTTKVESTSSTKVLGLLCHLHQQKNDFIEPKAYIRSIMAAVATEAFRTGNSFQKLKFSLESAMTVSYCFSTFVLVLSKIQVSS